MAIPKKDVSLVSWGSNFDAKVSLSPGTYSLTPGQAAAFHSAYLAFAAAFNAVATAREAGTRSKSLTSTKDASKAVLLRVGRELYGIVQDSSAVPAAVKLDAGVVVRKTSPSPVPPPPAAPGIAILATAGNTVKLRLFDRADPTRRGKPAGVDGAAVFSAVGPDAPTTESGWRYEGVTGVTRLDVTFPAAVPPGSRVWFTARWFNGRKQDGPAAGPVGTNIPGGAAMAA